MEAKSIHPYLDRYIQSYKTIEKLKARPYRTLYREYLHPHQQILTCIYGVYPDAEETGIHHIYEGSHIELYRAIENKLDNLDETTKKLLYPLVLRHVIHDPLKLANQEIKTPDNLLSIRVEHSRHYTIIYIHMYLDITLETLEKFSKYLSTVIKDEA